MASENQELDLAMSANGFYRTQAGWGFNSTEADRIAINFKPEHISFFGPDANYGYYPFFASLNVGAEHFERVFKSPQVTKVIQKYYQQDPGLATRIAFRLGGIIRHGKASPIEQRSDSITKQRVLFAARMTGLGQIRSGEAISSAISRYVIANGNLEEDATFMGNIYRMGEAVVADPIRIDETADLGLSQVARLRHYLGLGQEDERYQQVKNLKANDFEDFPTFGSEWHFPIYASREYPTMLKDLTLLNIAQHHLNSQIGFSALDHNVIEVRMNPSVYPIAIATWEQMKKVFPPLEDAYFFATLARTNRNFRWQYDETILKKLHILGLVIYANLFSDKPKHKIEGQMPFGEAYLGQTVRLAAPERYSCTGQWYGNKGNEGQMVIYAGFGDSFPDHAYYLSMGLADPSTLRAVTTESLRHDNSLQGVLKRKPEGIRYTLAMLQNNIDGDPRSKKIYRSGRIIQQLLRS